LAQFLKRLAAGWKTGVRFQEWDGAKIATNLQGFETSLVLLTELVWLIINGTGFFSVIEINWLLATLEKIKNGVCLIRRMNGARIILLL
jgi:hypothetical protein